MANLYKSFRPILPKQATYVWHPQALFGEIVFAVYTEKICSERQRVLKWLSFMMYIF